MRVFPSKKTLISQCAASDSGQRQLMGGPIMYGLKTTFCRHRLQNCLAVLRRKLWPASVLWWSAGFFLALASKDLPQLRLAQLALHSRDDHVELSDRACPRRPGVSIVSTPFRPLTGFEGVGSENVMLTVFRSQLRRSLPSRQDRQSSSRSTPAIVMPPSRNRTQPKYVVCVVGKETHLGSLP